jgi:hypothetical protein
MLHGYGTPMMVTIPAVHRVALVSFLCHLTPLSRAMFVLPPIAVVIAHLLMALVTFTLRAKIIIAIFRCRAHGRP